MSEPTRKKRKAGMCAWCQRKKPTDGVFCSKCKPKAIEARKRTYWTQRTRGKCPNCGHKHDSGRVHCESCRAIMAACYARRRDGLKAAGICTNCGKRPAMKEHPAVNDGKRIKRPLCHICYLKKAAGTSLGSRARWPEMEELLKEQDHRCAYTGELLELGRNSSVDHAIPKSQSGPNEIENLRWVAYKVNIAKNGMTIDQFIDLCRSVLTHLGYDVSHPCD